MRAAYPASQAERAARSVINFASNAGTEGMAGNAVYAATKEAIRGFSRSLAREWGRDGIRVNMIRPIAASPSLATWAEENPKLAAMQARAIPLGRFGDCDADIAPVAVFLASDESRYLTAVTLPADGGGGQDEGRHESGDRSTRLVHCWRAGRRLGEGRARDAGNPGQNCAMQEQGQVGVNFNNVMVTDLKGSEMDRKIDEVIALAKQSGIKRSRCSPTTTTSTRCRTATRPRPASRSRTSTTAA